MQQGIFAETRLHVGNANKWLISAQHSEQQVQGMFPNIVWNMTVYVVY